MNEEVTFSTAGRIVEYDARMKCIYDILGEIAISAGVYSQSLADKLEELKSYIVVREY